MAEHPVVVLLIDDQRFVGESVRQMLAAEAGVAFHFCQDPARAIAAANDVKPTVILQDLVMPGADGLDLVRAFRANGATRETPMIVLSSQEDPEVKARAFALGANDYLVKWPDKVEVVGSGGGPVEHHHTHSVPVLEDMVAKVAAKLQGRDEPEPVEPLGPDSQPAIEATATEA